ncbi:phospholipase A2group VI (cytosoliccalcium-independent) [Aphelenchoides avenae]|nr:phospholipase A2group VI (cytosoliccalcium-independent) [Aphelenchus avenae]
MNLFNQIGQFAKTAVDAKQVIDQIRAAGGEEVITQAAAYVAAARRSTDAGGSNGGNKAPVKTEKVTQKQLERLDLTDGFSVFSDKKSSPTYHVVFVESSTSVYKTADQNVAEIQKNRLNRFRGIAKCAAANQVLEKCVTAILAHPDWTEMHLACCLGLPDYVDSLFRQYDPLTLVNLATPDDGRFPIHLTIEAKLTNLTRALLRNGADVAKGDLCGRNAIHYAAMHSTEILQDLAKGLGSNFQRVANQRDEEGITPMILACQEGNIDAVKIFTSKGCKVENLLEYPRLHPTCLRILLKQDPSLANARSTSILHEPIEREVLRVVAEEAPFAVELRLGPGQLTPLHAAAQRNDLKSAVMLVAFGANLDVTDKDGNTPLHYAVKAGATRIVQLFLSIGADPLLKNAAGIAPYQIKSTVEIANLFKLLLQSQPHSLPRGPLTQAAQAQALAHINAKAPEERKRCLRLLSLDGGGIRGMVLIMVLMEIERSLNKGPLINHFDWIAGTSTGAILALALSKGFSLTECLRLYLQLKDDVFQGSRTYDAAPIERFLQEKFGVDTKMSEIKGARVLVTATKADVNPPELVVFRNYLLAGGREVNVEKRTLDPKTVQIWKAARCSSAAPTYFPSVDGTLMDGGLIANNPSLELLNEVHYFNAAKRLVEEKPEEAREIGCVVSVGTGRIPPERLKDIDISMPNSFTSFVSNLTALKGLMNVLTEQLACSDGQVVERAQAFAHAQNAPFFRFTPQLDIDVPLDTKDDDVLVRLLWLTKASHYACNADNLVNFKVYVTVTCREDIQTLAALLNSF